MTTLAHDLHLDAEILDAVRQLHHPELRYTLGGELDSSFHSMADMKSFFGEDDPTFYDDVTTFQICIECARIEEQANAGADDWSYLEGIWPCATAKAAAQSGNSALAVANATVKKLASYLEARQDQILHGELRHQTTLDQLHFIEGALALLAAS